MKRRDARKAMKEEEREEEQEEEQEDVEDAVDEQNGDALLASDDEKQAPDDDDPAVAAADADGADDDDGVEADEEQEEAADDAESGDDKDNDEADEQGDEDGEQQDDGAETKQSKQKKTVKPVSADKLKAFQEAYEKRGIIYLSRVPPFMKPNRLRTIFSQYGEVLRIFLTPEDASVARKRKKSGGNRAKKFVDGWVEFADKKVARAIADTFNNTPIGGPKRSFYHDDIWNIKYLKGFKWHQLNEELAYQRAIRENKMRMEMTQAKRESKFYLQKVEQAKAINAMQKRKKPSSEESNDNETGEPAAKRPRKVIRHFRQRRTVDDMPEEEAQEKAQRNANVMAKVFNQ